MNRLELNLECSNFGSAAFGPPSLPLHFTIGLFVSYFCAAPSSSESFIKLKAGSAFQ